MYRGTYAQPGGSFRRRRRRTNLFLALVFLLELAVIGGFAAWLLLPEEPNRPESSQPGPEQPSVSAPVEPEPVPEDPAVTQARTQLLEEARQLMRGYYYEEALQLLDGAQTWPTTRPTPCGRSLPTCKPSWSPMRTVSSTTFSSTVSLWTRTKPLTATTTPQAMTCT